MGQRKKKFKLLKKLLVSYINTVTLKLWSGDRALFTTDDVPIYESIYQILQDEMGVQN